MFRALIETGQPQFFVRRKYRTAIGTAEGRLRCAAHGCLVCLIDPEEQRVDNGGCVRLRVQDVFDTEELQLDSRFFLAHVPQPRAHIATGVSTRRCVRISPLASDDRSRVEAGVHVLASCSPSSCDIVQKV